MHGLCSLFTNELKLLLMSWIWLVEIGAPGIDALKWAINCDFVCTVDRKLVEKDDSKVPPS